MYYVHYRSPEIRVQVKHGIELLYLLCSTTHIAIPTSVVCEQRRGLTLPISFTDQITVLA